MQRDVAIPSGASAVRPDRLTLAAFVVVGVLGGGNPLAIRYTVLELPPFWGAGLRFVLAAACFWAIVLARRIALPGGRTLVAVLLYGLLDIGLSFALIYWGLQGIEASIASVIIALLPLLTFLLACAHRLESFRWRALLGALFAVCGIALAFWDRPAESVPLASLLAVIAGAVCLAESTVLLKWIPRIDPVALNAVAISAGTALLFVFSAIARESRQLPALAPTWLAILYLVGFGSVVLFYLFVFIVQRWTASATSYLFVIFPFVTIALGWLIAGETITPALLAGGAIVIAGVWIGALSHGTRREDAP
jgi:drug/metabolite transporter (DMT)-like permease